MHRSFKALFPVLLLASWASPVGASSLTLTLSPSTPGLTFTIENQGLVAPAQDLNTADGVNDTYKVLLTLTADGSYANSTDYLSALSVDFSNGSLDRWTSPVTATGGSGLAWTLAATEQGVAGNSGKCGGSEPGGLCLDETVSSGATDLLLRTAATYTWLFTIDLGSAGFAEVTYLEAGFSTLDVRTSGPNTTYGFHPASNISGTAGSLGLTTGPDPNPPTAPVPEPGTLVLLGSGLFAVASRIRRRR